MQEDKQQQSKFPNELPAFQKVVLDKDNFVKFSSQGTRSTGGRSDVQGIKEADEQLPDLLTITIPADASHASLASPRSKPSGKGLLRKKWRWTSKG